MKIDRLIFSLIIISAMNACNMTTTKTDTLADRAKEELNTVLNNQQEFIKVHAAEYLVWLGYPEQVKKIYLEENEKHQSEKPYRIGIWRVLAQSDDDSASRAAWAAKVMDVYGDPEAPDRLHATETLAKLQRSPAGVYPDLTQKTLASPNRNLQVYALWATSYASESVMEKNRKQFLQLALSDSIPIIRRISAYILRKIKGVSADDWKTFAEKAMDEPDSSELRRSMLNTAFALYPGDPDTSALAAKLKLEMLKDHLRMTAAERIELALTLADKGTHDDVPVLEKMLNDEGSEGFYKTSSKEGADVRSTAAYAILAILKKLKT